VSLQENNSGLLPDQHKWCALALSLGTKEY